jgi:hypothetical protein
VKFKLKDSREAFMEWLLMIIVAVGFAGYLVGARPGAWTFLATLGGYFFIWLAVTLGFFVIVCIASICGRPFRWSKHE